MGALGHVSCVVCAVADSPEESASLLTILCLAQGIYPLCDIRMLWHPPVLQTGLGNINPRADTIPFRERCLDLA